MAHLLKKRPTENRFDTETTVSHEQRLVPDTDLSQARTAIRIHKDGLMRGTYRAVAIAPSRIFIGTDPLSYPLDSRLEIEVVAEHSQGSVGYRLPATVSRRSLKGIELKLKPGQDD